MKEGRFRLLRRLGLIVLAYVAGSLAAGVLMAASLGAFAEGLGLEVSIAIGSYAGVFALFPLAVAMLCGELLGWRSIFAWMGAGGAMGLFALLVLGRFTPGMSQHRPYLFLAGLVWGVVYWAIAGRGAGQTRQL